MWYIDYIKVKLYCLTTTQSFTQIIITREELDNSRSLSRRVLEPRVGPVGDELGVVVGVPVPQVEEPVGRREEDATDGVDGGDGVDGALETRPPLPLPSVLVVSCGGEETDGSERE